MTDLNRPDDMLRVRIDRADMACEGIRSFDFVAEGGGDLPAFTPGSHITVQTPSGELRKYSLCGDPADAGRWRIAVKREEAGRGGSRSMVDAAQVGDVIEVSAPDNAFELVEDAQSYLFIAGGIGITPILSMIRSFGELPPAPWKLYYFAQRPETCAFREELSAPEFKGQVTIHHDFGDPDQAFDLWPLLEKPGNAHIYCCGPRGLMEAVRDMSGHWPSGRVHFESFNAGGGVKADDRPFTVELARSGKQYEVPVGRSILEVLRQDGVRVSSSCESGTCGSCRTRLVSGAADHRDMVLMPEEQDSQIMVCVSRAQCQGDACDTLVLDL